MMHSVDDAHLVMCRWAEVRGKSTWGLVETWKIRGVDAALSRVPLKVRRIASEYYHPDRAVVMGRSFGMAEVEVSVILRESLVTVYAALVHARLAVAYVLDDISDERASKGVAIRPVESIDSVREVEECG